MQKDSFHFLSYPELITPKGALGFGRFVSFFPPQKFH
jgi:hypothetical protein